MQPLIPPHLRTLDTLQSVVIVRLDRQGKLLEANAGFRRILPTTQNEPWGSITRPLLRELFSATPGDDGVVYEGKITLGHPLGEMRTLWGRIHLADDQLVIIAGYDMEELERLPGLLLSLNNELDTTQRALVRANRETARSEERFRIAARLTSDLVWEWNLTDDRFWWDDAIGAMLGYDTRTIPASPSFWIDNIHAEDRPRVVDALQEAIGGTRNEWTDEYRFPRADGTYALVRSHAFVIRDDAGKARRIVGSTEDITEKRNLEQKLQQIQHLESLARLTGGVAHEFNNLLTVILGNAETLLSLSADRADLESLATTTLKAGQRAATLTRHLLAFSRQRSLHLQPTDVGAAARRLDRSLTEICGPDVEVTLDVAPDLWLARTNPEQFDTALQELCTNACEAMPQGGRLGLSLANATIEKHDPGPGPRIPPGRYVSVTVQDTGVGMDEVTRRRAFDPFFTTREVGRGTGLGLSMIYGFVTQSAGHIFIDSKPGGGTTVHVYLPRAVPSPDAD
jgi:PAS domain S-box-containing protein